MRMSIIVVGLLFLITTIKTKSVVYVDSKDYFKEWPIDSSTDKHYYRVPAWTGGAMIFTFKVNKPHPDFKIDFRYVKVDKNATDEEMVNSQQWVSLMSPSKHSWDDYDIYYYYQNFQITYKGDVGIYFSSSQNYKMNFNVRVNGYLFPINSEEETIFEDFIYTNFFKTSIVGEGYKYMSFVVKAYKPIEVYDFHLSGTADYEIEGKSPKEINFLNFKIKEGNDYTKFTYPFYIDKDIKSLKFSFFSNQHYKLGFYVVYEFDDPPFV